MKRWTGLAAAFAAATVLLSGCSGGSDGAAGANGANGSNGLNGTNGTNGTNAVATGNVSTLAAADWTALKPSIDPASISISINSPPVVKFKVTDQNGNPVIGLGGQSKASNAIVPSNYNLQFTLAKLVPGSNGEPSKWVNYVVTKPVATGTAGAVVADGLSWVGTYPSPESNGTLVDNGDGTYQYTFLRDIKHVATIVAGLTDDATHVKADLGDVSFDPAATHRLGILINGSQPGTGYNIPVPDATKVANVTPVPLVNTSNIGYDFIINADGSTRAATATDASRNIVQKDSCTSCHDGKGIGHVSTNGVDKFGLSNGIPAGAFVGRNDPRLCVTCHTDQTKYGFANVTATTNADGSPAYSTAYFRTTDGQAAFTYPRMIHQTHMGADLVKTGYNLNGHCNTPGAVGYDATKLAANLAQCYNMVNFPQSQENCTKCHNGDAKTDAKQAVQSKDGNNWKNVPSMLACGACHDGINFADGSGITLADRDADVADVKAVGTTKTGHIGGAKANNATCSLCHDATTIPVYHRQTITTANNPTVQAGVSTISFNLQSVTVNATTGQPTVKFQILKDGALVTSLATPTLVTNAANGQQVVSPAYEPIAGFAGFVGSKASLSIYVAYSVPQDGITPADFNVSAFADLNNLLIASGSPKAGTLTSDGAGNWTAVLTGDLVGQPVTATCKQNTGTSAITGNCVNPSPIVIPATAKMVTGAIIGGFTQKVATGYSSYVAANVSVNPNVSASGGLVVSGMLQKKVATGSYTARRVIVDTAKCNTCHEQLGGAQTTPAFFHNGQRNDATSCNICHNGNRTNAGWSVDSSTYIHGIHAGSKRTTPYTWNAGSATNPLGWATKTLYPGTIKDCNQCHVANAVNFGATGGTAVAPNLLWSTVATGKLAAAKATSGPITVGTQYGNGFAFSSAGAVVASYTKGDGTVVPAAIAGAGGVIVPADPATLVNSPIASACYSCHDTSSAKGHMTTNGGAIYEARATALSKTEACLVCHGQGTVMDAAVVHQQGPQ